MQPAPYIMEIFEDNNWLLKSRHRNKENAVNNADVIAKSRKCQVRVIHNGIIIYESGGNNESKSRTNK